MRKPRPTSKYTQQPNQSPKEQVQKSNALHAEETCRLRAGSAPFSAPGAHLFARRETRRSARRKRAVLRAESAPFCAPEARRVRAGSASFCAPEDAREASRETCRSAPCDMRARAGSVGSAFLFSLGYLLALRLIGSRAGGGTPGVAPRCAGRPPHT